MVCGLPWSCYKLKGWYNMKWSTSSECSFCSVFNKLVCWHLSLMDFIIWWKGFRGFDSMNGLSYRLLRIDKGIFVLCAKAQQISYWLTHAKKKACIAAVQNKLRKWSHYVFFYVFLSFFLLTACIFLIRVARNIGYSFSKMKTCNFYQFIYCL